jgi:4-hydroxy-2-oxoheptanedioate aldolase
MRTAADAARGVAALRTPPAGKRGWGPFVAHSRWDVPLFGYAGGAGREVVCLLLLETREAMESVGAIGAVEGIDCVVIAPFDLSTELGVSGQMEHPTMRAAVGRIEAAVLRAAIPLGGVGLMPEAMVAKGYRLAGGFDVVWLKGAVAQARGGGR